MDRRRGLKIVWCAAVGMLNLALAYQLSKGPGVGIPHTVFGLARAMLSSVGADGDGASLLFLAGAVISAIDAVFLWSNSNVARVAAIALSVVAVGSAVVWWLLAPLAEIDARVVNAIFCASATPIVLLQWFALRRAT